jgi:DNA-binding NarL/FixJ family response regulator
MARILIIEDEPLIARDIKRILKKNSYDVMGICYDSDAALDRLAKKDYDLVLLDIHLKGSRNGIELAHIINEKYKVPFIYITSFADKDTIEQVKETMPAGYVVKPFNEKEVYSSIEIALFKNSKKTRTELSLESLNARMDKNLTNKEFQIIEDILQGLTNGQMATKHFISENTIKSHIKNIYNKMGTHSKPELVAKVMGVGSHKN